MADAQGGCRGVESRVLPDDYQHGDAAADYGSPVLGYPSTVEIRRRAPG